MSLISPQRRLLLVERGLPLIEQRLALACHVGAGVAQDLLACDVLPLLAEAPFPIVETPRSQLGPAITFVGMRLPRVNSRLTCVGLPLALIGRPLATVRLSLPLIRLPFPAVKLTAR